MTKYDETTTSSSIKPKSFTELVSREPTKEYILRLMRMSDAELLALNLNKSELYALGTPDGNGGKMVPLEGNIESIRFALKCKNTFLESQSDKPRSKL